MKKKDLDVRYILKTYWSFLRPHKTLILGLVICGITLSAIGLAQRSLFKKIIDSGELFAKNELSLNTLWPIITTILIIWIVMLFVRALARWSRIHFLSYLDSKAVFNLKQKYYNHIVSLDHKFHTTHKTGSMIARISRGSSAMERLTDFTFYNVVATIFEIFIAGGALMLIDKSIGLTILITGLLFVTYSYKTQMRQRKLKIIANNAEDIEKGFTADTLTNIDSIKYYGKENSIRNKYASITEKTKNAWLKEWLIGRWSTSVETLIADLGGLIALIIIIRSFLEGNTTLGTVVFTWTSYWSILSSVQVFMDGIRGYNKSIADLHDLFEYGRIQKEIKDKSNATNLEVKEGVIEFNKVSFKYHESNLFKEFNLVVPKNKKVALVGHSGSGKSTLVKLLYRLYDLDKGSIKIDGIDIKEVKQESLRSELSIVPQECVLFDDTIYNNILFSNPKASRKEVLQAIKFAQLDKTIANFPNKEDTIVGERGVKLSGGEKQRVSIARALLANKKILVLDEATSALDSKTEHEIQKDLQNLMQGRTSIIIAHRLSTIMNSDLIVVLKDGKIVQQGSHDELINQNGEYRELWNLQKGGYIPD